MFLVILIGLTVLFIVGAYQILLLMYLRRDGCINYDLFSTVVKESSPGNAYLNYGYWTDGTESLKDANEALAKLVFEKCKPPKDSRLLDVGCGFGSQDLLWLECLRSQEKGDLSSSITAVDIGSSQIEYANKERKARNIPKSVLNYIKGDAHRLDELFSERATYTHVLSLESAFHYSERPLFFKSVYEVLEEKGTFVISDIVLKESLDFSSLLFAKLFANTLAMPQSNFVTVDGWKESITKAGLQLESLDDITDFTFHPYYSHTLTPKRFGRYVPDSAANLIRHLFIAMQPFRYVMAVCRKPCSQNTDTS